MMYHGAFGYTKETPLEMLLRGVMSYEVGAEGGLMIMRGIIARDEWGDTHNPFKDVARDGARQAETAARCSLDGEPYARSGD